MISLAIFAVIVAALFGSVAYAIQQEAELEGPGPQAGANERNRQTHAREGHSRACSAKRIYRGVFASSPAKLRRALGRKGSHGGQVRAH